MSGSFKDRNAIRKAIYNPREFRGATEKPNRETTRDGDIKKPRVWTGIVVCCAIACSVSLWFSPSTTNPRRSSNVQAVAPSASPAVSHDNLGDERANNAFEAAWLPKIGTVPRCAKLRQRVHELATGSRSPSSVEVDALWRDVKRDACNMVS